MHFTLVFGIRNFDETKVNKFISRRDQFVRIHDPVLKLPSPYIPYEWKSKIGTQSGSYEQYLILCQSKEELNRITIKKTPFLYVLQQLVQEFQGVYLYVYDHSRDKRKRTIKQKKTVTLYSLCTVNVENITKIETDILYDIKM